MHLGKNIEKICKLKGIKQIQLGRLLNKKQQEVSRILNRETIDDDLLEKIASAIDISPEAIKHYNDEAVINNINQQGGICLNINPIDKIIELYEKQLKEKDKIITMLKKQVGKS